MLKDYLKFISVHAVATFVSAFIYYIISVYLIPLDRFFPAFVWAVITQGVVWAIVSNIDFVKYNKLNRTLFFLGLILFIAWFFASKNISVYMLNCMQSYF